MPPRRGDGFAEAVSSPAQLNQRFTFGLSGEQNLTIPGLAQLETQAGTFETVSAYHPVSEKTMQWPIIGVHKQGRPILTKLGRYTHTT